ncbi:MAG: hypothetical protein JSU90_01400 [Nitrospiraceae bacterium]|nr:MAG: hypothetical protein JSU90_01400 [Nitrospiraceae bacterium]
MTIRNEDVREIVAEIPEGHRHLRTTVLLQDGTEMTFQEATMAALVRAYTAVKTHPTRSRVALRGMTVALRKDGFAEWQLIEKE